MKFWDFADGCSNTILIVTTARDPALDWSRPQDWEVDLENPMNGLCSDDRTELMTARTDFSVATFPISMPVKALQIYFILPIALISTCGIPDRMHFLTTETLTLPSF